MDHYYKISHAQEEIDWLGIEVHHIAMYLSDVTKTGTSVIWMTKSNHPTPTLLIRFDSIKFSVAKYFHSHHKQHLCEIVHLPRFSGDIQPGISEKTEKRECASVWEMLRVAEEEEDDLMEEGDRHDDQQEAEEELTYPTDVICTYYIS